MFPSWTEKASPARFMSSMRPGNLACSSGVKRVSPMAPKSNAFGVGAGAAPTGACREEEMRATPSPREQSHRLVTGGSNHRRGGAGQVIRGGPRAPDATGPGAGRVPRQPGGAGSSGAGAAGGFGGTDGGFGGVDGTNCSGGTGMGTPGTIGAAEAASS